MVYQQKQPLFCVGKQTLYLTTRFWILHGKMVHFTFKLKIGRQTNMKGSVRERGKGQGVDGLFV